MIITNDFLKHSKINVWFCFILFSVFPVLHEGKMTDDYALFRVQICVGKEDSIFERTRASERKRQFVFQQLNKAIENEVKKFEFQLNFCTFSRE